MRRFSTVLGISTFILGAVIIRTLSPSANATSQTATSGDTDIYYASITNDDTVNIPITPTTSQQTFSATNDISFKSTCGKGATIYISTDSDSNDLTRIGSDDLTKNIAATTNTTGGLVDNSWGFSTDGTNYQAVPVKDSEVALYSSTSAETKTVNVRFGVKIDNNLPSGTYTNNVLYTVAVNSQCLNYTLKFDTDGGTTFPDKTMAYGEKIDLTQYTPTKTGFVFAGWTNGTSTFTGDETAANVNPSNAYTLTLTAQWTPAYPLFSSYLISLTNGASSSSTAVIGSTGLAYDGTADANLRYSGSNVNNYVAFNGELYRIIGVMKNVCPDLNCTTKETRVKIARNSRISIQWNTVASNKWETANSNVYFNSGTYWNSLSSESKNMIGDTLYYLGARSDANVNAKTWYSTERGTTVYSGNSTRWVGKVALMYPSDYGLSSSGCKDSSVTLQSFNNSTCTGTTWLYDNAQEWLLTPYAHVNDRAARINYAGWIGGYGSGDPVTGIGNSGQSRPTFYLKAGVLKTGGTGTAADPYTIMIL